MPEKQKNTSGHSVSLVIPCYNESQRVTALLAALQEFVREWKSGYEIIIVDDGSKDNTVTLIRESPFFIQEQEKGNIHLLELAKNEGKGAALKAGVARAEKNFILTMDADIASHPLELKKWQEQYSGVFPEDEILIGSREHPDSIVEGKNTRKFIGRIFNFLVQFFTSLNLYDTQCGFKLYPKEIGQYLFGRLRVKGWAHDVELLYRAKLMGVGIKEMPVKWQAIEGSKINVVKDAFRMLGQTIYISFLVKYDWYFKQTLNKASRKKTEAAPFFVRSGDHIWGFFFFLLSLILLILMPALSFDFGMSGDEFVQHEYGRRVLAYFTSFGEDKSFMDYKNLYLYGGLYEGVAAALVDILDTEKIFETRHFLNALTGFVALLFTGFLGKEITGSWRGGVLALLLIAFSPRFFGHAMNNPKDIPFAAAYIFSVYYLLKILKDFPKAGTKNIALLIIGIAAAIGVRVGGVLLIAYAGLFLSVRVLWLAYVQKQYAFKEVAAKGMKYFLIIAVPAYFIGILFWPYAHQAPLINPLNALQELERLSVNISILFEGEHISSDAIPWYYIPKWMLITTPIAVLLGIAASLVFIPVFYKKYRGGTILFLLFVILFPVGYAIYKDAKLYDGWRHFLFIYPPLVVFAALSWNYLLEAIKNRYLKLIPAFVFAGLLLLPAYWMVRSHPHQYVYFNEMYGGIDKAYGNYETDYYMNSVKPAAEWLRERLKNTDKEVIVRTNAFEPAHYYLRGLDNVKVLYTRYYDRTEHEWDYAIFYSRFIDKHQLKNGTWPPAKVIHSEEVDDVPLSAVVERPGNLDYLGNQAIKNKNLAQGIQYLQQAAQKDPKNESIWINLAIAYYSAGAMDQALEAVSKNLQLYPDNTTGLNVLGTIYLRKGDMTRAILTFNKLTRIEPDFAPAYNSLGLAYLQKGETNNAIPYFNKAIMANQRFKQPYQMLINIYRQQGNMEAARKYEQALANIK